MTDITSDADGAGRATLTTSRGPVKAKVVISCTGLHGDTVQQMAGISNFTCVLLPLTLFNKGLCKSCV